tara:strand:+ start:766 stop:1653 length:888 start_codon:yes stop_codon:yes gene_type:complete
MTDEKVAKEYFCENCNYKCFNKTNFDKHLYTRKHKNLQNTDEKVAKVAKDCKTFVCICGKSYKHRQSLFTHQSKCTYEPAKNEEVIETSVSQNAILEVVKKQQDQLTQLTDAIKDIAPKLGNNNTTNSHNTNNTNQFNINVFLNEDCKNAINMSDFIKSIEVSLQQLDLTKTKGLEKGITQVIMDNMNKLSVHERPLHCTDTKRETLYIKDNDKWEKDNNKEKIKEVIKKTQNKNYTALTKWAEANPGFMGDDSKQMYYAKAMSQAGKQLHGVDDKIIKNVCKQTYIKEDLNTIK